MDRAKLIVGGAIIAVVFVGGLAPLMGHEAAAAIFGAGVGLLIPTEARHD